jgi:hypothetical protein
LLIALEENMKICSYDKFHFLNEIGYQEMIIIEAGADAANLKQFILATKED